MHNVINGSPMLAERAVQPRVRADRGKLVKIVRRLSGSVDAASNRWRYYLDRYLEGWAEADLDRVAEATANDYRFNDPLVGQFSRRSLPAYFEHLQARFARAGVIGNRDFVFFFRAPVDAPSCDRRREYFREAPRLGLTGIASITIGDRGIVAEHVTYDLNLATDVLRSVT